MARSCFGFSLTRIAVFVFTILIGTSVFAADKKAPKNTNIDFEDELVEGMAQKPELFYLLQKKRFNYKRLIKLREDFIPEMKGTAQHVQHRGGRAE
jgi:hypothetical protein